LDGCAQTAGPVIWRVCVPGTKCVPCIGVAVGVGMAHGCGAHEVGERSVMVVVAVRHSMALRVFDVAGDDDGGVAVVMVVMAVRHTCALFVGVAAVAVARVAGQ